MLRQRLRVGGLRDYYYGMYVLVVPESNIVTRQVRPHVMEHVALSLFLSLRDTVSFEC